MKKYAALVTLLVWLVATHLGAIQTPLLFVLYDAGETHGLAPVMQHLDAKGSDFRVLVMGTARDQVPHLNLFHSKIIDLNDLAVASDVDRVKWQRGQTLPPEDLALINKHIFADIVMTGVASVAQQQIATTLKTKGSEVLAFYDNLAFPLNRHPHREVIAPFQDIVDLMLVPSSTIAASFSCSTAIVGQPSLETWTQKLSAINVSQVKQTLKFSHKPLMVYCGGYDGTYPEAFAVFADCIKGLDSWQVAIQLHPKADGEMEQQILRDKGIEGVRIFKDYPGTTALVAAADLVVCQHSTTGIQALLAGKSVIHVDLPSSTFSYFAIDKGLAMLATNRTAFQMALGRALQATNKDNAALYRAAGIPRDSTDRVLQVVNRYLPKTIQPTRSFFHSSGM